MHLDDMLEAEKEVGDEEATKFEVRFPIDTEFTAVKAKMDPNTPLEIKVQARAWAARNMGEYKKAEGKVQEQLIKEDAEKETQVVSLRKQIKNCEHMFKLRRSSKDGNDDDDDDEDDDDDDDNEDDALKDKPADDADAEKAPTDETSAPATVAVDDSDSPVPDGEDEKGDDAEAEAAATVDETEVAFKLEIAGYKAEAYALLQWRQQFTEGRAEEVRVQLDALGRDRSHLQVSSRIRPSEAEDQLREQLKNHRAKVDALEERRDIFKETLAVIEEQLPEFEPEIVESSGADADGWMYLEDPASGRGYWLNEQTGESQWAD